MVKEELGHFNMAAAERRICIVVQCHALAWVVFAKPLHRVKVTPEDSQLERSGSTSGILWVALDPLQHLDATSRRRSIYHVW